MKIISLSDCRNCNKGTQIEIYFVLKIETKTEIPASFIKCHRHMDITINTI